MHGQTRHYPSGSGASHIEAGLYCNSLLAGLPQSTLAPLQRVQNAAARLVFELGARDHVTASLIQLHWLPVHWRIQFKLCLHNAFCFYGNCPADLTNIVRTVTAACCRSRLRPTSRSPSAMVEIRRAFLLTSRALSVERSAFRHSCCWGHESVQTSRQNSLF